MLFLRVNQKALGFLNNFTQITILSRRPVLSMDQALPCCFYFKISWILMERHCFYFFVPSILWVYISANTFCSFPFSSISDKFWNRFSDWFSGWMVRYVLFMSYSTCWNCRWTWNLYFLLIFSWKKAATELCILGHIQVIKVP